MSMQCNATEQKERSTEKSKKKAVAITVIVTIRQIKSIKKKLRRASFSVHILIVSLNQE